MASTKPSPKASKKQPVSAKKRKVAAEVTSGSTKKTKVEADRHDSGSNDDRVKKKGKISWTGPHAPEQLLLHIQYECARHNVKVPWDAIANRLNPGSTGPAIDSYLYRTRDDLVKKGILVPPTVSSAKQSGASNDQNVRGFVRKFDEGQVVFSDCLHEGALQTGRLTVRSNDLTTTRAVDWHEPLQVGNVKFPDSGDQPDVGGSAQGEDQGGSAGVETSKGKLATRASSITSPQGASTSSQLPKKGRD